MNNLYHPKFKISMKSLDRNATDQLILNQALSDLNFIFKTLVGMSSF